MRMAMERWAYYNQALGMYWGTAIFSVLVMTPLALVFVATAIYWGFRRRFADILLPLVIVVAFGFAGSGLLALFG